VSAFGFAFKGKCVLGKTERSYSEVIKNTVQYMGTV